MQTLRQFLNYGRYTTPEHSSEELELKERVQRFIDEKKGWMDEGWLDSVLDLPVAEVFKRVWGN